MPLPREHFGNGRNGDAGAAGYIGLPYALGFNQVSRHPASVQSRVSIARAMPVFARQQILAQFKQAVAGRGYLEAKDAQSNRLVRGSFKAMDRDGDGKVSEKELLAYLDHMRDLQARASAA